MTPFHFSCTLLSDKRIWINLYTVRVRDVPPLVYHPRELF